MKVFLLLLIVFFAKESKSLCEDQINTNLRVIAMRRELKTNCSWKITAPNLNRLSIKVSVLHPEEENSTLCPNYLKLEEIKDNQKNLLKRYCTPVARDYIKSNFNQILVTAYNIKFKLSWKELERKEAGVDTDEIPTTTEKPIFQTTNKVHRDKTSSASHKENNFIVVGSSSGLLMVFLIGFVIKKICCNRLTVPTNHEIYKMDNLHTNTTDELDDHGNLQMTPKTPQGNTDIILQKTSKKTTRNSNVRDSVISGIVKNNETECKTATQGSTRMKENKKHSVNRRRGRSDSSKEEHIYSNANITDVEKDNYWCLGIPYVNHMHVFIDTNEKTNLDTRHSSTSSSDSAEYSNLN